MKVIDFIRMLNWKIVNEQGISFILPIGKTNDFANAEIVGKIISDCSEMSFDDDNFFEQYGINIGNNKVQYDVNGEYKYIEDVEGNKYIILN